jgi:molybdate transport system regulatory protein
MRQRHRREGKEKMGSSSIAPLAIAKAPTMRLHLWLETPEGLFFGIGRAQLLAQIETHGSLKQAATELGMSYRAAWGKIRATETALGQKIIQRSGHRRQGHALTAFGKQLMDRYNQWYEAVERYAAASAENLFPWPIRRFAETGGAAPAAVRKDDPHQGEKRASGALA